MTDTAPSGDPSRDAHDDDAEDDQNGFVVVAQNVPMELGAGGIPSRMAVAGIRLFGSASMMVGKMYMTHALQTCGHASKVELAKNIAQCTLLAGALESQAARYVVVRIPYVGETFAARFLKVMKTSELDALVEGGIGTTVRQVGVRGRILVIIASLLVHEFVEFSWMLGSGQMSMAEFIARSGEHILTALGSLGGGAVGTAVGTLAMPGVGTGIGSFAGSILGATLASYAAAGLLPEAAAGSSSQQQALPAPAPVPLIEGIPNPTGVGAAGDAGSDTANGAPPADAPSGYVELVLEYREEDTSGSNPDLDRPVQIECCDVDPDALLEAAAVAAAAAAPTSPGTDEGEGFCMVEHADGGREERAAAPLQ